MIQIFGPPACDGGRGPNIEPYFKKRKTKATAVSFKLGRGIGIFGKEMLAINKSFTSQLHERPNWVKKFKINTEFRYSYGDYKCKTYWQASEGMVEEPRAFMGGS